MSRPGLKRKKKQKKKQKQKQKQKQPKKRKLPEALDEDTTMRAQELHDFLASNPGCAYFHEKGILPGLCRDLAPFQSYDKVVVELLLHKALDPKTAVSELPEAGMLASLLLHTLLKKFYRLRAEKPPAPLNVRAEHKQAKEQEKEKGKEEKKEEEPDQGNAPSPRDFLRYDKIEKFENQKWGRYAVCCYSNGLTWVCPNPMKPEKCECIDNQDRRGFFIEKKTIYLTHQQFDDEFNWI